MADIRINALATTAASTASDDFLAVDGSSQGTRKLNAYSPTFGGNVVATGTLTVNSTTDSSSKDTGAIVTEGGLGVEKSATIGGNLTVSGTGSFTQTNTGDTRTLSLTSGTLGTYLGGYLNANTYLASNWYYNGGAVIPDSTRTTSLIAFVQSTSANGGSIDFDIGNVNTSPAVLMRLNGTGNLLLKSDGVDSGNGKLQLATHGSYTGGIGFGTDTSLFRLDTGYLQIDRNSGTGVGLVLSEASVNKAGIQIISGNLYIDANASGKSAIFRTNGGTTAMTLDSSQNAEFAGNIKTAAPSGGTAATWRLGTVATVSPTSPNRTIEVQIGATTYYISAKTTND